MSILTCSCQNKSSKTPKKRPAKPYENFEIVEAETSGISFTNNITESETFNFLQYEYLYNGAGVAVGDVNNDGLIDIYFTGNMVSDRLYINKGDFKFQDITDSAGLGKASGFKTGVNMVDINNDGLVDIYVCRSVVSDPNLRRNLLYINNGDLTFTERSSDFGLDDPGYSVQSYFFDSDSDGVLEAYILNHPKNMRDANNINVIKNKEGALELSKEDNFNYVANRYYVRKSDKYTDMTKEANLLEVSFGLSAVVRDFNQDGLTDIYVANDYIKPDQLWINKGNHSYEEQSEQYFKHTSFSSMGSDYADINNDSQEDLMVLDMLSSNPVRRHTLNMTQNIKKFKLMQKVGLQKQLARNVLQVNQYPNQYVDVANMTKISSTDWSWNVLMADFDNNSHKDIHITNGYYRNITNLDYMNFKSNELQAKLKAGKIKMLDWLEEIPSKPTQNFFYKNLGDLNFEEVSDEWNAQTQFSNGGAYADLNNDGYLDIVVNNINAPAHILKNNMTANEHHYIEVKLIDPKHKPTINTKATVYLEDGRKLTETLNPQRGFLSSSQHRFHFGIGSNKIDSLKILWPDKTIQTVKNPKLNQILSIRKNSKDNLENPKPYQNKLLTKVNLNLPAHQENTYNEFDFERLIDRSYSDLGPAHLIFDFNNDGKDDILLGGATGYPTKLMTQVVNGNFKELDIPDFIKDKKFEDTVAISLDFNNDGYPDIILGSASNEKPLSLENYPLRLYLYKPAANTYIRTQLNDIAVSTTSLLAEDFNQDGYVDIFVGARNYPKYYPKTPKSYVLKGTKNGFVDVSQDWFKDSHLGMITDAKYEDLDNDGKKELIVIGEWMSPMIFEFNAIFKNVSYDYGLSNLTGLWENLLIEDVNQDGYNDMILANRGLDNLYRATPDNPVKLVYGDIDDNLTNEYLLFNQQEGNKYTPLHGLDRISTEIPSFKRRFNSYEAFAKADWSFVLNKKNLLQVNEAQYLKHLVLINKKDKSFNIKPLPNLTQNSIIKDIAVLKTNKNENIYVIAGNDFNTDAEFTLYDNSNGYVLEWNKDLEQLEIIPYEMSGFVADKNVRGLNKITILNQPHLLIFNNNSAIESFRYQKTD